MSTGYSLQNKNPTSGGLGKIDRPAIITNFQAGFYHGVTRTPQVLFLAPKVETSGAVLGLNSPHFGDPPGGSSRGFPRASLETRWTRMAPGYSRIPQDISPNIEPLVDSGEVGRGRAGHSFGCSLDAGLLSSSVADLLRRDGLPGRVAILGSRGIPKWNP